MCTEINHCNLLKRPDNLIYSRRKSQLSIDNVSFLAKSLWGQSTLSQMASQRRRLQGHPESLKSHDSNKFATLWSSTPTGEIRESTNELNVERARSLPIIKWHMASAMEAVIKITPTCRTRSGVLKQPPSFKKRLPCCGRFPGTESPLPSAAVSTGL